MLTPHYAFETFDPEASVGYLIKRCGVLVQAQAEKAFEGQRLTYTQWVVLSRLRFQGGSLTATMLSEILGHDPGALTRVIDGLERQGLVSRTRSLTDRRVVAIVLTPEGLAEVEIALHQVIRMLNQVLEPFTRDEVATLVSLLQRVQARLQARLPGHAAASTEEPA